MRWGSPHTSHGSACDSDARARNAACAPARQPSRPHPAQPGRRFQQKERLIELSYHLIRFQHQLEAIQSCLKMHKRRITALMEKTATRMPCPRIIQRIQGSCLLTSASSSLMPDALRPCMMRMASVSEARDDAADRPPGMPYVSMDADLRCRRDAATTGQRPVRGVRVVGVGAQLNTKASKGRHQQTERGHNGPAACRGRSVSVHTRMVIPWHTAQRDAHDSTAAWRRNCYCCSVASIAFHDLFRADSPEADSRGVLFGDALAEEGAELSGRDRASP